MRTKFSFASFLFLDSFLIIYLSPRDSQESSPTPQFKSINSLAFSFLHSPTFTSIHDHWKNHSLDQTDLSWQSNVSAFKNFKKIYQCNSQALFLNSSLLSVFPNRYRYRYGYGTVVKNPPTNVGDAGLIPGSGRSPGEINGNPLPYSCLGSPMDRGACCSTVHGVAKSQTQLSDFTFTFS